MIILMTHLLPTTTTTTTIMILPTTYHHKSVFLPHLHNSLPQIANKNQGVIQGSHLVLAYHRLQKREELAPLSWLATLLLELVHLCQKHCLRIMVSRHSYKKLRGLASYGYSIKII
jgi:hypothetical protein